MRGGPAHCKRQKNVEETKKAAATQENILFVGSTVLHYWALLICLGLGEKGNKEHVCTRFIYNTELLFYSLKHLLTKCGDIGVDPPQASFCHKLYSSAWRAGEKTQAPWLQNSPCFHNVNIIYNKQKTTTENRKHFAKRCLNGWKYFSAMFWRRWIGRDPATCGKILRCFFCFNALPLKK